MSHIPQEYIDTDKQFNIHHIHKPEGNFVEVPEDIFERMVAKIEDLEDLEAIRNAKENPDEYFPAEFVYACMDAKTTGQRIALWMGYRGLKQIELAKQAEVSPPYLSEIMHDKKPGSLSALKAIAKVLRADLEDITGY